MDFDSVIKKRKSVRSFKNKKASFKLILEAVDSAIQGPFSGNQNNLKFLIVEEGEDINAIASYCDQAWITEASVVVVVCSDDTQLEQLYGERGRVYSRQQAGAAINTFILKLTDLDLDSCWVGAYDDEMIRERLEIPGHVQIEAVVPVGYGEGKFEKSKKKDLENSIRWEKWRLRKRPSVFEERREDYRLGAGADVD